MDQNNRVGVTAWDTRERCSWSRWRADGKADEPDRRVVHDSAARRGLI